MSPFPFGALGRNKKMISPEMHSNHLSTSIDRLIPRSPYNSNTSAITAKVIEDINFLQDRIARIKKLQTPNSAVLKTYQSMLESRESVLQWLNENGDADDQSIANII
jgi:hypothetical protein